METCTECGQDVDLDSDDYVTAICDAGDDGLLTAHTHTACRPVED